MKVYIKNLLFSFTAFLLLTALATPHVVKTIHAFFEHQDVICSQKSKVHLHQTELNCDFQHYHITAYLFSKIIDYLLVTPYAIREINKILYNQISKSKKLNFSLRGPPK